MTGPRRTPNNCFFLHLALKLPSSVALPKAFFHLLVCAVKLVNKVTSHYVRLAIVLLVGGGTIVWGCMEVDSKQKKYTGRIEFVQNSRCYKM